MSTKKFISKSVRSTKEIAAKFAGQILRSRLQSNRGSTMKSGQKPSKSAVVLALQGELGSGKTTFLQGFAKGLGIKEKILSPTFIVMKKFKIPKKISIAYSLRPQGVCYKYFFHFDCYRLNSEKDLEGLGFKEIISNPQNIVAIEWPEKIKSLLPKNKISIKFKHINKTTRNLTIIK